MTQIYNHHNHYNESAYKQGVRVYKDILKNVDYPQVKSL